MSALGQKRTSQVYSITSSIRASSCGRHTSARCPHRTARPTVRRSMHSIDSGACRKQSLWTIRSSEQSCTDSSFEFEETGWFETSKLALSASTSRPNKRRAKGYVHAYSISVAQIEAADSPAAKPVPGMRRRDRSCRDRAPPSAR